MASVKRVAFARSNPCKKTTTCRRSIRQALVPWLTSFQPREDLLARPERKCRPPGSLELVDEFVHALLLHRQLLGLEHLRHLGELVVLDEPVDRERPDTAPLCCQDV